MFLLRGQASRCFARVNSHRRLQLRAMKLDRRWWVAIGVAVLAAVALVLSYTVFDRPSEECRPVKDLLDFNRSQAEHIAAKTGDEQGVPTAAEEAAYQVWADGLAERAQNVSVPRPRPHRHDGRQPCQRVRRQAPCSARAIRVAGSRRACAAGGSTR